MDRLWRRGLADPSRPVEIVRGPGFGAVPFDAGAMAGLEERETRRLLRAIAVAGFAAGNAMLLSIPVWSGPSGRSIPTACRSSISGR